MRRRGKLDANHSEIVEALRSMGASVQSLAGIGSGAPDLAVGWHGKNFLFEIKDGSRRPSERKLTDDEKAWHYAWTGQVAVIESVEAALEIMEKA